MKKEDQQILVIGAGIVGLACAFFLNAQGYRVRIIHEADLDASTSCGNAGAVAVAGMIPLAGPGVLLNAPKWLIDPLGPLSIRASYMPRLLPWFWHFIRAGTNSKRKDLSKAMMSLLQMAFDDHDTVLSATNLQHLLQKKGTLYIYRSEQGRLADKADWDIRSDCGIRFEALDRRGVLHYEPALGPRAANGYRVEEWAHYRDPAEIVGELANHLKAQGVIFEQAQVDRIHFEGTRPVGVKLLNEKLLRGDQIIVAAGAWSTALSRQLGDPFPLESERGYNTTLPDPGIEVRSFVTFSEDHFVMTPMQMGLRIGGAVEFAGLKAPPNYGRSKALLRLAKRYLPDLNTEGGTEWMGNRPATPDSLPVISPSRDHDNVFYAFGHGHLGLTGSMTTGRVIADLVAGKTPDIDLSPFHIGRFGWRST